MGWVGVVIGHLRYVTITLFDRARTRFCQPSIETMSLCCIVSETE